MGLVNTALHIGRSAITSYQGALSVIGNNIANAADSDYTRQRAVLDPVQGAPLPEGIQPGGGVALTSLERVINEALEDRLRLAIGQMESSQVQSQILSQIETSFNELTDNDISSMLSALFNSFQDVQNNPTDVGLRSVAVGNAQALAQALRRERTGLGDLVDEINQQIVAATTQADGLAQEIADLNVKIVESEAGGHIASGLRDSRDAFLRDLAQLIEITVRSQESGTVSVFVGNETLVHFGNSRGLTTKTVVDGEFVRQEVHFAGDSGQAEVRGGQLKGLAEARDIHIVGVIDNIDQLAGGLIALVNEAHSNGQGLVGYLETVGTSAVDDPDAALNDPLSGLDLAPQTGSFFIAVTDQAGGQTVSFQINIDLDGQNGDDTTLNSLVAQINGAVANVTASVSVENKLTLTAAAGFEFTFGHDGVSSRDDSSNVLAALGVNTFFQGKDATDIRVNDTVTAQPELLAAAGANVVGDGGNAGLLAAVGESAHARLDQVTLFNFYNQVLGTLGVTTASAGATLESADSALLSLQQQRASISGVNLDEEAIELLRFQRAFQGAARFTSVIDRLIAEMLSLVR